MNRSSILLPALLAVLTLTACDKPIVVNVPPPPVAVAGPAGPAGATGEKGNTGNTGTQGNDGSKGDAGKAGEGATVIVIAPAASAPSN